MSGKQPAVVECETEAVARGPVVRRLAARRQDFRGRLAHLLAFGFGSGYAPFAPGTFGTAAGVVIYVPLLSLPLAIYVAVTLGFVAVGIWCCERASEGLDVHDHPGIVWDEITGFMITMIAAPRGWAWIVTGFVLFRIFDILKPWPAGYIDRRCGDGTGIMLDDIAAGLYALACMQAIAALVAMQ